VLFKPLDTFTYVGEHAGSMPLRLTHAVLAICLNLGTPQGIRTKTEEAFFDPSTRHHERSMRAIMNKLVDSVENVQKMSILAVSADENIIVSCNDGASFSYRTRVPKRLSVLFKELGGRPRINRCSFCTTM